MAFFEIVQTALTLADRDTQELRTLSITFMGMVESRLNRKLRVGSMSVRSVTDTLTQDYYALPLDYLAIRDIEIQDEDGLKTTLQYLSPEQANDMSNRADQTACYYTLIARQIHIVGQTATGKKLEIVYYQSLPKITLDSGDNWLSYNYEDIYIYGMMVEIMAYAKNSEGVALWDARFLNGIKELNDADASDRHSGTALQMRVG